MIRKAFAFSFFVMAFSFVAEASQPWVPRPTLVDHHLTMGYFQGALRDAQIYLEDRERPSTRIHALNHILQIHRKDQAVGIERLTAEVANQIRTLAEQHAADNPEDLVAQHNLGYVVLNGIGGEQNVDGGIELLRRTARGALQETFLLVDRATFLMPDVEHYLRIGFLEGAMIDAQAILRLKQLPITEINVLNHILQIHRSNDDKRIEGFTPEVAMEIRAMAQRHLADNPEDVVVQHNIGYVLLNGIGGYDYVAGGIRLLRKAERGGLPEAFQIVDRRIYDNEPNPSPLAMAYAIMRPGNNDNWKNHPALVAWITAIVGANLYIGCK